MASYTVTSDRLAGHARGDVVDDDLFPPELAASLIAGGHLAPDEPKSTTKATSGRSKKE